MPKKNHAFRERGSFLIKETLVRDTISFLGYQQVPSCRYPQICSPGRSEGPYDVASVREADLE